MNQSTYILTSEQQNLGERATQSIILATRLLQPTSQNPYLNILNPQEINNLPTIELTATDDNLRDVAIEGYTVNVKNGQNNWKTLYIKFNTRTQILSLPIIPDFDFKLITQESQSQRIDAESVLKTDNLVHFVLNQDANERVKKNELQTTRVILVFKNNVAIAKIPIVTNNQLPKNQHLTN